MHSVRAITIPYKNDVSTLTACLKSLAATTGVELNVVVVDNAPTDENHALAASILPKATYSASPYNLGFAKATNVGLQNFTEDFVILVNPDTSFPPDAIARLAEHMAGEPEVGVGSVIIRGENGEIQKSLRKFPTLRNQIVTLLKIPHIWKNTPLLGDYIATEEEHFITHDVDSIMGAFMMVPRRVIESIGGLDEGYFIWFEEVDYCKMVVDAGLKVRHYADIEARHVKGQSFGRVRTLKKQRWVRTSFTHYLEKHHGPAAAFIWRAWFPIFTILAWGSDAIVELKAKLKPAI